MSGPNVVKLDQAVREEKRRRKPPATEGGPEPQEKEEEPTGFGAVVPLGVMSRRGATAYVFLDAAGLQQILAARDMHAAACISSLYAGASGKAWLARRWPHMSPIRDSLGKIVRDEKGLPVMQRSGDFSARIAGDALMAACTAAGPVERREMRLDGVWLGPSPDSLVIHCGDRILADGEVYPPGHQHGSAVYLAAAPRPRPTPKEATKEQVAQLWKDLNLWAFSHTQLDAGPALLLGMVANGILAAALPWRPHMLLRGPFGSGKSALMRWIAAACGGSLPTTDTSEAALRQVYDNRAVLIPVDEAEANTGHIARILDLMRGASGRQGAVTARGNAEGEARTFRVNGCFLLAAITPVVLAPADASRITLLQMRRPAAQNEARVEEAISRAKELYPALLRRLQNRFGIYLQNRALLRAAAVERQSTGRAADQLAALLAGWQVLAHDEPLTQQDAGHILEEFREFYLTEEETAEEDTPQLVLQHFLGSRIELSRDGRTTDTIAGALSAAWSKRGDADFRKEWASKLGRNRLKLTYGPWPPPGLWIGSGPATERLFADTRWKDGVWHRALRDLQGVEVGPTMHFTDGGKSRGTWLPLELLALNSSEGGE
ncbi:hypothetical protein ACFFMP_08540 [Pseudoroseomonas cervicalis]|uniref:hypothetical protein n=1 Tax=Teichococcus cervicalis TaxID=204525 RepID=UPI0035EB89BB